MYLRIRHSTTYRYGGPVAFGPHRLMLRPRDSFDLRVVDTALTISPRARLRWMHDPYGNSVAIANAFSLLRQLWFDCGLRTK
jgi:transglutaminase-like putative cysteine protease